LGSVRAICHSRLTDAEVASSSAGSDCGSWRQSSKEQRCQVEKIVNEKTADERMGDLKRSGSKSVVIIIIHGR